VKALGGYLATRDLRGGSEKRAPVQVCHNLHRRQCLAAAGDAADRIQFEHKFRLGTVHTVGPALSGEAGLA
jgi:hypothetical protein